MLEFDRSSDGGDKASMQGIRTGGPEAPLRGPVLERETRRALLAPPPLHGHCPWTDSKRRRTETKEAEKNMKKRARGGSDSTGADNPETSTSS